MILIIWRTTEMNNSTDNILAPVTRDEYVQAFEMIFPTLDSLKELLDEDGQRHLSDLVKYSDIMLRYQTDKSYQEGFADGKKSE